LIVALCGPTIARLGEGKAASNVCCQPLPGAPPIGVSRSYAGRIREGYRAAPEALGGAGEVGGGFWQSNRGSEHPFRKNNIPIA